MPIKEYENLPTKERLKRIDEALDWIIIALYPLEFDGEVLPIDADSLNEFAKKRWADNKVQKKSGVGNGQSRIGSTGNGCTYKKGVG